MELTAKRVNARHFGHTMLRTDALIRGRRFDTDAVIAVNAWLKARAHKYIAAGERDWLYPEQSAQMDMATLTRLLLPPKQELWRHGGEIYIGYKDGSFGYRDSYGRTSRDHELSQKRHLPLYWLPRTGARVAQKPCLANAAQEFILGSAHRGMC
ncbi:hypothetical protein VM57_00615 [Stenotrophomonas maltophilia]|uniref:Uncharacterized protein n=1 Tax=Stenotrophomonas maltophilia TaxID=40324 RepID=A0A0F5ZQ52_STEMA|nr:hypothetical protein VM57_00615 [Stenotrophomonas maltophilia]